MGRAEAQQRARVYRIAVVNPSMPVGDMNETGSRLYRAFFQRLRQLGYVEGQNLSVERWSGEGRTEHFAELAGEVVRSKPDLIFVQEYRLMRYFKPATDTIPMVGYGGDPTAFGIVSNLARPGGNITGVMGDTGTGFGKPFQFIREMIPAASRAAFLASPAIWDSPYGPAIREQAQKMGMSLLGPPLTAPFQEAEYRRVFAAMVQEGADALLVSGQMENTTNRRLIVELAEKYRLPAIYTWRDFTEIGGLLAYGADLQDVSRHAAEQVDQIFKGTKPGDIPFYQPTRFELTINLKTAKALGLTIPFSLIASADEVIE